MYEIQQELKNYYEELNPSVRLEILEGLPENDCLDFIRLLYNERYSDHEKKGRKNVDWWLWDCICLQQLYNKGGFFKRFREREVSKIMSELFMNDHEETHRTYLYHEYRNLCRRYLSTCKNANYASSMMGFKKAEDDEKVFRACLDVWQMSEGAARIAGKSEGMILWCEALRDELLAYDKLCAAEFERLNNKI